MSQADVERVIGRLATDGRWRGKFRASPEEALQALVVARDLDVSPTELRALRSLSADILDALAAGLDPRIQRLEQPS